MFAYWRMQSSAHQTVYVVDAGGRLVGVVRRVDPGAWNASGTLADIMDPLDQVVTLAPEDSVEGVADLFATHPDWSSIPVVDGEGLLCGVIGRGTPLRPRLPDPSDTREALQAEILGALTSGFVLIDAHGVIRTINDAGAQLLGIEASDFVGQPYEELAQTLFRDMQEYLRLSGVPVLLRGGARAASREFRTQQGRMVQFDYGAVRDRGNLIAVVVTFTDVTAAYEARSRAEAAAREAELAFGLTLPNTKVEAKLRSSPEYQDDYDPQTGEATVTAVIPAGTYWHVVNGLRLMAELKALGVFQLVGLDKDTLVQAFIFHDLGKEQPMLTVGQRFVPSETFEPGYLHAARSAEWAVKEYKVSDEAAWIIRYHHTASEDLPRDFPEALKPMWRLLKVVDGLSAGITRRQAQIAPLILQGTTLTIREANPDGRYHRAYRVSLYSGQEEALP